MAILGAQHGLRTRAGFNVEIRLDGDWFRLNDITNRLGPSLGIIAKEAQQEFAEAYKKKVKQNIMEGGKRFGYEPLSPQYKRYKSRGGGRDEPLYWGGSLHDSIEVMSLSEGRVGVGVPKNTKRPFYSNESSKGNKLTISEYANILEHGTRGGLHIPARPVFSDTFKQDMKGMKGLKNFLITEITTKANLQGIPIRKI